MHFLGFGREQTFSQTIQTLSRTFPVLCPPPSVVIILVPTAHALGKGIPSAPLSPSPVSQHTFWVAEKPPFLFAPLGRLMSIIPGVPVKAVFFLLNQMSGSIRSLLSS